MPLLQRLRQLILNFSQAQISAGAGSVVDYGLMVLSVEVFRWDLFWAEQFGNFVLVNHLNLLIFMRCTETVEEVYKWYACFQ